MVKRVTVEKTSTLGPGDEVQKEDRVYFVVSGTLSCLSLRQGNAIISGSEDVKKEHVVLFSVTSLPGREWAERTYLSLSG